MKFVLTEEISPLSRVDWLLDTARKYRTSVYNIWDYKLWFIALYQTTLFNRWRICECGSVVSARLFDGREAMYSYLRKAERAGLALSAPSSGVPRTHIETWALVLLEQGTDAWAET